MIYNYGMFCGIINVFVKTKTQRERAHKRRGSTNWTIGELAGYSLKLDILDL